MTDASRAEPLLAIERLEVVYGPAQALFGVDLTLGEGEMLALLGRNGMGKTTTLRAVCGLARVIGGRISLAGRRIDGSPAHHIARAGVGLSPEGRRVFAPLTVAENLRAAARPGAWTQERVTRLFPRLGERAGQRAGALSGGEQQMLAISRALMTNPRVLLLDEATEGLAPTLRHEIWDALAALKREGQSCVVVDANLRDVLSVADHAVALERGAVAWSGAASELAADPTLQARLLGV